MWTPHPAQPTLTPDGKTATAPAGPAGPGGSVSLRLAIAYLGTRVDVVIDRPYGSRHPVHGFRYETNYGYLRGTCAPDGDELDAYFLGPRHPLTHAGGTCVAIVHRLTDDDDILVVPDGYHPTDTEILTTTTTTTTTTVAFQEIPGKHQLIRTNPQTRSVPQP